MGEKAKTLARESMGSGVGRKIFPLKILIPGISTVYDVNTN